MNEVDKMGCVPDSVEYTDEFKDWFDNSRKDGYLAPNPYHYWKQHNGHPFLRKFALKLFIHAGSSVACERFFSVCKRLESKADQSCTTCDRKKVVQIIIFALFGIFAKPLVKLFFLVLCFWIRHLLSFVGLF